MAIFEAPGKYYCCSHIYTHQGWIATCALLMLFFDNSSSKGGGDRMSYQLLSKFVIFLKTFKVTFVIVNNCSIRQHFIDNYMNN